MLSDSEIQKRQSIIDACRQMNARGINQGTSGNISLRDGDGLLITPTSLSYDLMQPEDIVRIRADGTADGRLKPSTEWRFHRDILAARPEVQSVVHTHSIYATIIAILGRSIPAVHYMVAAAGGPDVRCAPYATFGTEELSHNAVAALAGRKACLLDHHGVIATGSSIANALWLAVEVENLARQYHGLLQVTDTPPLLSDEEIANVIARMMGGYGHGDSAKSH